MGLAPEALTAKRAAPCFTTTVGLVSAASIWRCGRTIVGKPGRGSTSSTPSFVGTPVTGSTTPEPALHQALRQGAKLGERSGATAKVEAEPKSG